MSFPSGKLIHLAVRDVGDQVVRIPTTTRMAKAVIKPIKALFFNTVAIFVSSSRAENVAGANSFDDALAAPTVKN